jgi:hypothetical protein
VVEGFAKWPESGRVTRLWLIKAAWDEQSVRRAFNAAECGFGPGDVNCVVAMFYGNQTHSDGQYLSFPQHGTAALTLNSSSYINLAYRDLGRMTAKYLQLDAAGRVQLRTPNGRPAQCVQTTYVIGEGRPKRPAETTPTACIPL